MKKFIAILAFCGAAIAQGVILPIPAVTTTTTIGANTVTVPAPNVSVLVCTSAGSGIPCNQPASIYQNQALTTPAQNPGATNAQGIPLFSGSQTIWVSPGVYIVSETGSAITGGNITIQAVCAPAGTCTITGGTLSGTTTNTGTVSGGAVNPATAAIGALTAISPAITPTSIEGVVPLDTIGTGDWCSRLTTADAQYLGESVTFFVPNTLAGTACASGLGSIPTAGHKVLFDVGTFTLPSWTIVNESNATIEGAGKYLTTLAFSASGVACSNSSGGDFSYRNTTDADANAGSYMIGAMTISALANTGCLMAVGGSNAEISTFQLRDVHLETPFTLGASSSNPIALAIGNAIISQFDDIDYYGFFSQGIAEWGVSHLNAVTFDNLDLQANSESPAAGVWNTANYEMSLPACQACSITRATVEWGPNGIFLGNGWPGSVKLSQIWTGDWNQNNYPVSPWFPDTAWSLGEFIFPTVTTKGTSSSATLNNITVSSTANMYAGMPIYIQGAGTSGATFESYITGIAGDVITMGTSAAIAVTAANVAIPWYTGTIYRASTAGTSGSSQPTWPSSGTVTDGTATLLYYGSGAGVFSVVAANDAGGSFYGGGIVAAVVAEGVGFNETGATYATEPLGLACVGCRGATVTGNTVTSIAPGLYANEGGESFNFTDVGGSSATTFAIVLAAMSGSVCVASGIAPTGINGPFPCITMYNDAIYNMYQPTFASASNCASAAGSCGSAPTGIFTIAASATTATVTSSAITGLSDIVVTPIAGSGYGNRLGVTCNSSPPAVSVAINGAGSFTVTAVTAPATDPACYTYFAVN